METPLQQYLVFRACHGLFAIETPFVLETFALPEITPLAAPHPSLVGVINLRGTIIPILDLNLRFDRAPDKYRITDGVVVLAGEDRAIGIIVSEVLDVVSLSPEEISPPPFSGIGTQSPSRFTLGMAKIGENLTTILDSLKLAHFDKGDLDTTGVFPSESPAEEHAEFRERAGDLGKKPGMETFDDLEQVAVVSLGGEYFGIEVKAVQEFTPLTNLTPIPNCPEHIVGNMNLRGHILTVIDIRGPLGMPPGEIARSGKVMVTSTEHLWIGITVEDIFDITWVRSADISPLPASVRCDIEKHARGTVSYAGKAMTLLNIQEILKSPNLPVNEGAS